MKHPDYSLGTCQGLRFRDDLRQKPMGKGGAVVQLARHCEIGRLLAGKARSHHGQGDPFLGRVYGYSTNLRGTRQDSW